jgi:hypothetical protein
MKSDNSYTVAIFGIPEFERGLVERIFSLSKSRDNIYQIVDESQYHTADIALVDQSNAAAASDFKRIQSNGHVLPAVIIPNGKDPETDFWVKRPFTAMRMLGALDKLVENQLSGVNRPRSKAQSPAPAPNRPEATAPIMDDTASRPAVAAGIYKALVVDDSLPVRKQVNI